MKVDLTPRAIEHAIHFLSEYVSFEWISQLAKMYK